MIIKNNKKIFFLITFFVAGFLFSTSSAYASSEVGFIANTQSIKAGDSFNIDLKISALKTSINTVDGTVIYDPNKLEIKEINTDNSVLSLWPKPAVFDNSKGELSFVGGVTNGFLSQGAQVLKITFMAKKEGKTKIDFTDSFSVYQNDGKGTRISPWLKPIEISILPNTTTSKINYLLIISLVLFVFVLVFIIKRYAKNK